jgi:hypothetical protein
MRSAQLCWVIPIGGDSGAHPEHPWVPPSEGPPPGIWPSPGHPAHPIAPGGPPPGIWPSPGRPTHPIAPGGRPPGIWGGPPLYPDHGLPGDQPHPDQGLPGVPPVPTHPIFLPIGPDGAQRRLEAKTAWTEQTGWVVVFVPTDEAPPMPTPATTGQPT